MRDEVQYDVLNSRNYVFVRKGDEVVECEAHPTGASALEVFAQCVDHHEAELMIRRHELGAKQVTWQVKYRLCEMHKHGGTGDAPIRFSSVVLPTSARFKAWGNANSSAPGVRKPGEATLDM